MRNLFDENSESPSDYEMMNGDYRETGEEAPAPQRRQSINQAYADEIVQFAGADTDSDIAYDLEEEEQDVVTEAMVRLEQARLYDMLIKHNMFEGVHANPIALRNVQEELKQYIVERLQILLGIKTEKQQPTSMKIELPFNKLEIQALKDLAFKLTKGDTSKNQERQFAEATPDEEFQEIKPVRSFSKPQGLRTLASKQSQKQTIKSPTPQKREPEQQNKNVMVNKTKKVKIPEMKGKKIMTPNGEVLSDEEIEIARQQLENEINRGKSKNPYEMNEDELLELSRKNQSTQKRSTKIKGLPMPDSDQVHAMYEGRQRDIRSSNSNDADVVNTILGRVLSQK
jgi:hypothetical protein